MYKVLVCHIHSRQPYTRRTSERAVQDNRLNPQPRADHRPVRPARGRATGEGLRHPRRSRRLQGGRDSLVQPDKVSLTNAKTVMAGRVHQAAR